MTIEGATNSVEWVTLVVPVVTGAFGVVAGLVIERQRGRRAKEERFHEGRVEAVKSVWAALENAQRALQLPADIQGWTAENQNVFDVAGDEFRRKFIESRLYFPPHVVDKLDAYWNAMKDAGSATKWRTHRNLEKGWMERYDTAVALMRKMKGELEPECRKLLGDLDAT